MFTLNCKGRLLTITHPIVMGILNMNDDSFYSDSRHSNNNRLLDTVQQMIADGAAIIDIGGQSTRPGSHPVGDEEELARVLPGIKAIHQNFPEVIISVDTYYAKVAYEAVNAGASMVNDISGGSMDEEMIETVASLNVPYVLMHMQGTPQTMQSHPHYDDICREVLEYLIEKTTFLRSSGIKDIIIDPGFGFGKTAGHNFALLKNLEIFKILNMPLLLGISRKGLIYKTLGTDVEQALNGTTVLNTIGLINGANIIRVHDVKQAVEAIRLTQAVYG